MQGYIDVPRSATPEKSHGDVPIVLLLTLDLQSTQADRAWLHPGTTRGVSQSRSKSSEVGQH